MRHDTIELLKENMDKTFFDINCTSVFIGQSPKVVEIKVKNKQMGLHETKLFCTVKEDIN